MNKQSAINKLKRVVIKEELVALTGHYVQALILNQFIYWSERTKDFDQFVAEERKRDSNIALDPTKGWVYKTAEELSDELMLGMSVSTIRRHLGKLIKSGLLDERNNPKHKWDRTLQYRPNMVKIQTDLFHLGYALEGYPLVVAISKMKNGSFEMKNGTSQNERAIPETTSETTSETISPSAENEPHGQSSGDFGNPEKGGEPIIQPEDSETIPPCEVDTTLRQAGYDLAEVGARIKAAAEKALAKVEISEGPENEPDALTEAFGPNPRQAQSNGKPTISEADAAHLLTFGHLPDDKPPGAFDTRQEIKQSGWEVWDPTVEQGIAHYIEAVRTKRPNFAIPNNISVRKDWYKDIAGHLQDYKPDDLPGLYSAVIDIRDNDGHSFARPGSLTKTLPDVANAPAPTNAGPILTEAEKARLAELTAQFSPIK